MFTGIVEAVGQIVRVAPLGKGLRLTIDAGGLPLSGSAVGDSICVQGACLTVTRKRGRRLDFDVSRETLDCTTGLDRQRAVNLERSLRLGDRLDGHLVTGHVDGVGKVLAFEPAGESRRLRIQAPKAIARYLARKGSVCVDGVSLTVNRLVGGAFEANLIPHTLAVTTLGSLARGARVNLEVDLVARYVARTLEASS